MRRFFFLQNSPVDCFAKPKELTELETGRSQFVRAGVQRVQPFVHGYRECNTPVQVKGGSLAQLSGVSPLSTGYYLTQKAARNQLRCPSPLSGKSKRKGGTHVKLTRHNGRAGKNGVYNPKHNDRSFDINDIMNNAVTGWRAFSNPRYFPEPYRRQKGWERIRNDNEPDNSMDGFQEIPTEEMEQLGLPEEWLKQK